MLSRNGPIAAQKVRLDGFISSVVFCCWFSNYSARFHLLHHQGSCPWSPCLFCPTSATPPWCISLRSTSLTLGRPGSASEAPGSTRSSGHYRPSWVGAATAQKDPAPRAPSSGTSARSPASLMCCASSCSACCFPCCSWSTHMAEFCLESGGWVWKAHLLLCHQATKWKTETLHD